MLDPRLKQTLLSLSFCFFGFHALANIGPSPAGGGLDISQIGGSAYVQHDDFSFNLFDEVTIEMWLYLKRDLELGESWVLWHRPNGYVLVLTGHGDNGFDLVPLPAERRFSVGLLLKMFNQSRGVGDGVNRNEFSLDQWHHIAWIHSPHTHQVRVDGKVLFNSKRTPFLSEGDRKLYFGGTDIGNGDLFFRALPADSPFIHGLVDEIRVSNIARYPLEEKLIKVEKKFNPDPHTIALWHFVKNCQLFGEKSKHPAEDHSLTL